MEYQTHNIKYELFIYKTIPYTLYVMIYLYFLNIEMLRRNPEYIRSVYLYKLNMTFLNKDYLY